MSEPEDFLTRWSRRKLDDEEADAPAPAEAAPQKPAEEALRPRALRDNKHAAAGKPAFDLASLPSLDSIGAETDIRAFLSPGVPGDLRPCGPSPRLDRPTRRSATS